MDAPSTYRTPYDATPGSSTPSPHVTPSEGIGELRAFFWLALLSSVIIAVSGVVTWFLIH